MSNRCQSSEGGNLTYWHHWMSRGKKCCTLYASWWSQSLNIHWITKELSYPSRQITLLLTSNTNYGNVTWWAQVMFSQQTHTPKFNGLFSRTTWVNRHQKGKPFWILLKQEMMGWQWHQLDHIQIICTRLQTDNHTSTPSLNFLRVGCSSWRPTNSVKALKARIFSQHKNLNPTTH